MVYANGNVCPPPISMTAGKYRNADIRLPESLNFILYHVAGASQETPIAG